MPAKPIKIDSTTKPKYIVRTDSDLFSVLLTKTLFTIICKSYKSPFYSSRIADYIDDLYCSNIFGPLVNRLLRKVLHEISDDGTFFTKSAKIRLEPIVKSFEVLETLVTIRRYHRTAALSQACALYKYLVTEVTPGFKEEIVSEETQITFTDSDDSEMIS